MSPQLPGFNRGIWKRLEELVRAIALKEKEIYVVTGAIFPPAAEAKYLQSGKITVPKAYYKVVYDLTPPVKMIGFIIPHRPSDQPLQVFAVSVDEVEKQTDLDFFSKLPDKKEDILEVFVKIEAYGKIRFPRKNTTHLITNTYQQRNAFCISSCSEREIPLAEA